VTRKEVIFSEFIPIGTIGPYHLKWPYHFNWLSVLLAGCFRQSRRRVHPQWWVAAPHEERRSSPVRLGPCTAGSWVRMQLIHRMTWSKSCSQSTHRTNLMVNSREKRIRHFSWWNWERSYGIAVNSFMIVAAVLRVSKQGTSGAYSKCHQADRTNYSSTHKPLSANDILGWKWLYWSSSSPKYTVTSLDRDNVGSGRCRVSGYSLASGSPVNESIRFRHDILEQRWFMLPFWDGAPSPNIRHGELASFQKRETVVVNIWKYIILMIEAKCLVAYWLFKRQNTTIIHVKLATRFRVKAPASPSVTNCPNVSISAGISSDSEFAQWNHRTALLTSKLFWN
jgi:hypothetical protein